MLKMCCVFYFSFRVLSSLVLNFIVLSFLVIISITIAFVFHSVIKYQGLFGSGTASFGLSDWQKKRPRENDHQVRKIANISGKYQTCCGNFVRGLSASSRHWVNQCG